jgi:hypothetical protein
VARAWITCGMCYVDKVDDFLVPYLTSGAFNVTLKQNNKDLNTQVQILHCISHNRRISVIAGMKLKCSISPMVVYSYRAS